MARNGAGVYNLPTGQQVVTRTIITATTFNTLTSDLATALTNSVAVNGESVITANIPMAGYKITGIGAGTARTDAASIATIQDGTGVYVSTVGGTADVITLAPSPAITAYAAGQQFTFLASGSNTTNVTVAISGLAAKAITRNGTTALIASDILSSSMVTIKYDGTQFQILTTDSVGRKNATNTWAQIQTFTGNNTHTGDETHSGIETHSGAETHSGIETHSNSEVFSGTPSINLTGGQIKFPATQSTSSDANTLDDYEEGTWTPSLLFGGGNTGMTYNNQNGYYTKVGNLVTAFANFQITAKGSSTGDATITGLPITIGGSTVSVSGRYRLLSYSGMIQCYANGSSTVMNLQQIVEAGTTSNLTDANFSATTSMLLTISYIA